MSAKFNVIKSIGLGVSPKRPAVCHWQRIWACAFLACFVNLLCVNDAIQLHRYEVVAGSAEFTVHDESTLTINASNNAIVNYKSFDIAANEKVIVNDTSSQILNRVTLVPTNIYGTLTSNGLIILVNESGIYSPLQILTHSVIL